MENPLNRKYEIGMPLNVYEYKNYGVSLLRSDRFQALSEWVYLKKLLG
jgi:hypothetical protein